MASTKKYRILVFSSFRNYKDFEFFQMGGARGNSAADDNAVQPPSIDALGEGRARRGRGPHGCMA